MKDDTRHEGAQPIEIGIMILIYQDEEDWLFEVN